LPGRHSPSRAGKRVQARGMHVNRTAHLDDPLARTGRFGGGLRADITRRLPFYLGDFREGLSSKVVASTLFLFFACLANAVAFGGLTSLMTGGEIGTVEMIVATAFGGILFALFAGQPLTILGGTGPIVIFTGLLYQLCQNWNLPFLPVYAWVGLWSGLFMVILALVDASALMRLFTRFTDEIFAALVAVIFIVEAIKSMLAPFAAEPRDDATALMTLVLALGTFMLARSCKMMLQTPYMHRRIREFIADFGPAIAIAVMTGFALVMPEVEVERAAVPETVGTTTGRTWLVDLFALPAWVIAAASGPALLVTVLLFLDQNITTRLVNSPLHALRKGPGYHLDLAVVGIITAICSLFALPWIVAATVHSLNHVKSLATTETVSLGNGSRERIIGVQENRVSPLLIHVGIAGSIFMLPLLRAIPMEVLFGLFLYMGFATLNGTDLFERVRLWLTDGNLYPQTHYVRTVPRRVIHYFTLIQVACLAALWLLKSSPAGILFPLLIAMLVPLRYWMGRVLAPEHLETLDADEETDARVDEDAIGDFRP
jgi:hypothetical protein